MIGPNNYPPRRAHPKPQTLRIWRPGERLFIINDDDRDAIRIPRKAAGRPMTQHRILNLEQLSAAVIADNIIEELIKHDGEPA